MSLKSFQTNWLPRDSREQVEARLAGNIDAYFSAHPDKRLLRKIPEIVSDSRVLYQVVIYIDAQQPLPLEPEGLITLPDTPEFLAKLR